MAIDWAVYPSSTHQAAALQLARLAVKRDPAGPGAAIALARLLVEHGSLDEALACLKRAHEQDRKHPALAIALANALEQSGDIDRGISTLKPFREQRAGAAAMLRLLRKHDRHRQAADVANIVAAGDPANPDLLEWLAVEHRGDPGAMIAFADRALQSRPGATNAIFHKALALSRLGQRSKSAELMALDRVVQVTRAEPDGWRSNDQFNATLKQEILANPTLAPEPAGHATRHGLRTRFFPLPEDPASKDLIASIRGAIDKYIHEKAGDHPSLENLPRRVSLAAWALVFRARGHQVVHHHPEPWLTGVYYVAAPAAGGGKGLIRIGVLPDWAKVEPPWPIMDVAPEPGTLVIFPSFVPHCTIPTGSDNGERISVAFDIKRAD